MSQDEQNHQFRSLAPFWWFVLLVAAAWVFPQTPASNFILCPFRWLTDLICPGCGMTRAVTTLVRGDLAASINFHPGGLLLVASLMWVGGLRIADRLVGREVLSGARASFRSVATPFWVVVLVALMILWVVRLYFHIGG